MSGNNKRDESTSLNVHLLRYKLVYSNYCGSMLIRGDQCSWIIKILLICSITIQTNYYFVKRWGGGGLKFEGKGTPFTLTSNNHDSATNAKFNPY